MKDNKVVEIKNLSISDLYYLYLFVSNDANNRMFGKTDPKIKEVIIKKQKEIEQELYERTYGYNLFAKFKTEYNGMKPEDIDLNNVEHKESPRTFVIAKNKVARK
jgi:hypothetical protein